MPQPATGRRDLPEMADDRFVIKAKLGGGGMGEVFLADDRLLKRRVALKVIRPEHWHDANFHGRLLREAERASQLNDEHIARVYDVVEHNGRLCLIMEYVQGETLRAKVRDPLATEEFFSIAEQCLAAIAAAHQQGILHCDLKPDNVMITPAGVVKILDFGLSRRLCLAKEETRDTVDLQTTPAGGTLAYMAPEVLLGDPPDQRADIFSIGVMLYEALTGKHPFRGENGALGMEGILRERPRPISGPVLAGLDTVLFRMLAKDPSQRYQTCADVLVDLRAVHAGRAPAQRSVRREQQPRIVISLAAMVVLGLLLLSWPPARPPNVPPAQPRLLAVLPFQPADQNDGNNLALANGLTATLTARLGELAEHTHVQIVPATERRGQKAFSTQDALALLGANLALEGSLQRSGHALRVTYSLVDTASQRQVHSGVITEENADIFELQNHVIGEVLNSLDIATATEDLRRTKSRGTTKPQAYDAYVRGYGYLHVYDRAESLDNAIAAFQASLVVDPRFALAWAGLGQAYLQKLARTPDDVARAKEACTQAIELDQAVPDGEICLGMLLNRTGEYEQAAQHLERAVKLDPDRDEGFRELAESYDRLKRPADAEACLKTAINLRPQYWAGHKRLGKFYYDHGRSEEAIEKFKDVVRLAPGNFSNYSNLGGLYVNQGRYGEATPVLEKSIGIRRTDRALSNLAVAYFYQGKYQEAARTYEEALQMSSKEYKIFGNLAEAYAQLPGQQQQSNLRYGQALGLAERDLSVNRNDAEALSYAALYAARLGQRTKAELYRQRSLALSSGEVQVRENSALVLAQFRQDKLALAELRQAVSEGLLAPQITGNPAWQRFTSYPEFKAIIAGANAK